MTKWNETNFRAYMVEKEITIMKTTFNYDMYTRQTGMSFILKNNDGSEYKTFSIENGENFAILAYEVRESSWYAFCN